MRKKTFIQSKLLFVTLLLSFASITASAAQTILIEAEAFTNHGGWVVDQQFMDQMGSPFLLAHGLGKPAYGSAHETGWRHGRRRALRAGSRCSSMVRR